VADAFVHAKVGRGARCRQSVLTACRLHAESGHTHRAIFMTLTYGPGVEWEPGHVRTLHNRLTEYCRRRGVRLRCTWVLELTKKGVPHYHIVIFLPKPLGVPRPDDYGWWPHGMTKVETARCAVGYLAKYASKGIGTAFSAPKGARITGCRGLTAEERDEKAWWMKPRWVREVLGIEDRPQKVRGGYLSRATGELLLSPWRLSERGPRYEWMVFTDDPPAMLGCGDVQGRLLAALG
jgi:hypothetical protein